MRKIRKILILILIAIAAVGTIRFVWKQHEKQTQREWFDRQDEYISQLSEFSDNLDDVVTLYVTGSIGSADFANHIRILNGELTLLKRNYDADLKAHPVKIGTETYETKKGVEAISDLFDAFEDIMMLLGDSKNYNDSGDALVYRYMAYQQRISQDLADYLSSELILTGYTAEELGDVDAIH